MFGLGIGEILVILVIVLLVFGPEKLPDFARTLGRTVADLKRTVDDLKHEINTPYQEMKKEIDNIKSAPLLDATNNISVETSDDTNCESVKSAPISTEIVEEKNESKK
ncbi:MAG: twin-arginine translocase TatA/TatE family subunit [Proteobacteria bacterium]|nr:twin-arginine translocase TatA/TatE family subunit [Pseudomonadota bacterium]